MLNGRNDLDLSRKIALAARGERMGGNKTRNGGLFS